MDHEARKSVRERCNSELSLFHKFSDDEMGRLREVRIKKVGPRGP